jgi:hypothetical protein
MSTRECDECRAIRQEYTDSYIAILREVAELLQSGDKESALAWIKARKLNTEEDVLLAEQLFPAVRLKSSQRVGDAIRRFRLHQARTGHKPSFRM